jgi:hypothetical protein
MRAGITASAGRNKKKRRSSVISEHSQNLDAIWLDFCKNGIQLALGEKKPNEDNIGFLDVLTMYLQQAMSSTALFRDAERCWGELNQDWREKTEEIRDQVGKNESFIAFEEFLTSHSTKKRTKSTSAATPVTPIKRQSGVSSSNEFESDEPLSMRPKVSSSNKSQTVSTPATAMRTPTRSRVAEDLSKSVFS